MKARQIYEHIDLVSPFSSQESWDNSGLLLDSGACEQIVCAVDIDDELLASLQPNTCVILHHPVIFKGLKSLASGHEARILLQLTAKNCSLICAHTNFDKSHLNRYLCEQVLGFSIKQIDEFVIYCANEFSNIHELIAHCKNRLDLPHARAVIAREKLEGDIAICCGAGASMAEQIYGKAGVYLTGDIKYHEGLAAKLNGLNMLDITHYASEKCFANAMLEVVKDLPIKTRIGAFLNPFVDI